MFLLKFINKPIIFSDILIASTSSSLTSDSTEIRKSSKKKPTLGKCMRLKWLLLKKNKIKTFRFVDFGIFKYLSSTAYACE